jgi:MFS family permease
MRMTVSVLVGGLSILLVGHGLLGTLLGVRATIEHFNNTQTGLIMASYYAGYILGTWSGLDIIRRVGHIRTFAASAALCAITTLLFGLLPNFWVWLLLRFLSGVSLVGLYMVVESWLNEKTASNIRGLVFGAYMITTLLALAGAQFLLLIYDPASLAPFALAAVLIVLAIIPVAVTRVYEPQIGTHEYLPMSRLFALSPLGVAGIFSSGIVTGAFWGMTAVFGARMGMDETGIATLMSAVILGGALLQLPIGHLSDRYNRRSVLLMVSLMAAIAAGAAGYMVKANITGLNLVAFLYGGLMFSVYAISVAHTNDYMEPSQVLSATRALLLFYGLGALFGPFMSGWIMDIWGAVGLPLFSAVILLLFNLYGLYRITRRAPLPMAEQAEFVPLAKTSPVVMEMHPQAEMEPELDLSGKEGT